MNRTNRLFAIILERQVHGQRHSSVSISMPSIAPPLFPRHANSRVLPWLLSWGRRVRVLEPDCVRESLRREAEKIIENHSGRG